LRGIKSAQKLAKSSLNLSLTVACRLGKQKYSLAVYTQHKKQSVYAGQKMYITRFLEN